MDDVTVAAALRRFPLVGRPRPDCPALPLRVKEVTNAAHTATEKREHGMADAAHALNKAALIASDAGMTDLARQLCWHHIDAFRRATRPLTIREAHYMLEPVLNLARLHIRAEQGAPALQLLKTMHDAVKHRTDLTIEGNTLPTANLLGDQSERRALRQWAWLQLLGEGVRTLALADRWADAAEHARTHNGVGVHLMEGRQAVIIAACTQGNRVAGRALLATSTPTQQWEQQVAASLDIICTEPTGPLIAQHLDTAIRRFAAPSPAANYASYRVRLGLTLVILANPTRPRLAKMLLRHIAAFAIESADGYAARDVLGFRDPIDGITDTPRATLRHIAVQAGLGTGPLPETSVQQMSDACDQAVLVLEQEMRH